MQDRKPNLFVRFFSVLWRGFNALRKILHFVLLAAIFMVVLAIFSSEVPTLPERAALVLNLNGELTEQFAGEPLDRALDELTDSAIPQTLVRDVVEALAYAADDDRIPMVVVRSDGLVGASMVELQAVADAITAFRDSGKQVIASGAFYSQQGYFIAAHADEIWVDPNGGLLIQGFGRFRNYFADAIDKLSITWNVFKVGTHKSYVEPYTRNDMSPEDRESSERLLGGLWQSYMNTVERERGLDAGAVQNLADNLDGELAQDAGDLAATALRLGFVDRLLSATDARARLIDEVGAEPGDEWTFRQIDHAEYAATKRLLDTDLGKQPRVGVVVASGTIIDGEAPPGQIGGQSTARLLREARLDDDIQAVVLRIDSGGGSAFASDVILREIENIKAAGKPVIASMGGVAASGGYWIAMAADQIVAHPDTITGSIGIFGMFPTFERSLARLGIYTDGYGTTELASMLRLDKEPSDQVKRIFQLLIEDGYSDFVTNVADYRGMTVDAVDAVGQGQVWTGTTALSHGLVDSLGDLDDAIAIAAERAGLDDYDVDYIEPKLSAREQFVIDLISGSAWFGVSPEVFVAKPSPVEALFGLAERELAVLRSFNDPNGVYARCFCAVE